MIPRRGETKTALVTGASRGIGPAIAERLAAEGYRVFANDVEALRASILRRRRPRGQSSNVDGGIVFH